MSACQHPNCGAPLSLDTTSAADALAYGTDKARWACPRGHDVWMPFRQPRQRNNLIMRYSKQRDLNPEESELCGCGCGDPIEPGRVAKYRLECRRRLQDEASRDRQRRKRAARVG